MKFHSVAILGAGAVGSYVLWGLSKKAIVDPVSGKRRDGVTETGGLRTAGEKREPEEQADEWIDLCVVASGERKERFERDGIVINDTVYHPAVRTPKEAHGVDLLIVTLKYNGLRPALADIREIVDEHTTVLSLMNGVESEELIGEAIGSTDNIVWSLVKVSSERRGNSVRFDPEVAGGIIFGERRGEQRQTASSESTRIAASSSTQHSDGQRASAGVSKQQDDSAAGLRTDRVEALCDLFADTGLHYHAAEDILKEIWIKFRLNIELNLVQAVVDCGAGAYQDSEHVKFVRHRLGEEVNAIAEAKGVHISDVDASFFKSSSGSPRARYSTLQDLDAKRHTEIEMFSGAVMRMGRELGIPTPYNECVYHLIKAIEEKNDGRFDYA